MDMRKFYNPPSPLKDLLTRRRMTVRRLAEGLGLDMRRAQLIVDGHLMPLAPERKRIADFLSVPQGEIFIQK